MTNLNDFRVEARDDGGPFDVVHQPSGRTVLTTMSVSVEDLVRIVTRPTYFLQRQCTSYGCADHERGDWYDHGSSWEDLEEARAVIKGRPNRRDWRMVLRVPGQDDEVLEP